MKREILFRGKRADNGEWVEGFYVFRPDGNNLIYWKPFEDASQNTYHIVDPDTVGQFTGLTDKNGKPIFEGDVLNYFGTQACYTYVISYENGCFIATHTKIKAHDYKPLKWGNVNRFNELSIEIEVIGNIHDNPELS